MSELTITVYRVRERIGEPDTFDIRFDGGGAPLDLVDCPVNKPIPVIYPESALLAACKAALELLEDDDMGPWQSRRTVVNEVRDAIAKAEGREP